MNTGHVTPTAVVVKAEDSCNGITLIPLRNFAHFAVSADGFTAKGAK